jgi:hypothetical protein
MVLQPRVPKEYTHSLLSSRKDTLERRLRISLLHLDAIQPDTANIVDKEECADHQPNDESEAEDDQLRA